jgi:hypothetical protein
MWHDEFTFNIVEILGILPRIDDVIIVEDNVEVDGARSESD